MLSQHEEEASLGIEIEKTADRIFVGRLLDIYHLVIFYRGP